MAVAVERVTNGRCEMSERAVGRPRRWTAGTRGIARTLVIMVATLAGLLWASTSAGAAAWTALAPDAQSSSTQVTPIDLGSDLAGPPLDTTPAVSHLGVAISPDGRTGYVVSAGSGVLIPIDLSTGSPTVETPVNLTGAAGTVYIADLAGRQEGVRVRHGSQRRRAGRPDDEPGDGRDADLRRHRAAGDRVLAGRVDGVRGGPRQTGTVTPITVASNTAGTPISGVGTSPNQIAITPDGKTAYVTDNGSNKVYPIALPAGTVGSPISVGGIGVTPLGIAITPDGTKAYTANFGPASNFGGTGNTVTPIDLSNNTAGTPITVGGGPWSIAVTPDSKTVYVGNSNDSTVTPIDVATDTAGTAITGVGFPRSLAITPDQAPVANFAVTQRRAGPADDVRRLLLDGAVRDDRLLPVGLRRRQPRR